MELNRDSESSTLILCTLEVQYKTDLSKTTGSHFSFLNRIYLLSFPRFLLHPKDIILTYKKWNLHSIFMIRY